MPAVGHLEAVGVVVRGLAALGLEPILVGGMALVVLGSRRVTRDFDFLIPQPGDRLPDLLEVLYDQGFELASRVDQAGEVTATIGSRRVAGIRLRIDGPSSAYFLNRGTGLRIDLLFDFPMPAVALARRATTVKVRSVALHLASEADLLRLKQIARAGRTAPGDAEDIAFLEARRPMRGRRKGSPRTADVTPASGTRPAGGRPAAARPGRTRRPGRPPGR